jgi:glycerol kinase
VWFVPAFTGLGAPHWDAEARGLISGLTLGTTRQHVVRAGLEATAYQTRDLLDAFAADGVEIAELRVDGGMVANDWLMQFLADICARPVFRPDFQEMTALGAAALGGMALGWTDLEAWANRPVPGRRFAPLIASADRESLLSGWRRALSRARTRA